MYMTICVSVTFHHVTLNPLYNISGDSYRRWINVIPQEIHRIMLTNVQTAKMIHGEELISIVPFE